MFAAIALTGRPLACASVSSGSTCCVRANNRRAQQQAALRVGNQLDIAAVLAVAQRFAVSPGTGNLPTFVRRKPACSACAFGISKRSHLRLAVGCARDHAVIQLARAARQCFPRTGCPWSWQYAPAAACRSGPRWRERRDVGAHLPIHRHETALVQLHAQCLEPQALDVGSKTHGD